jgi:hypothetical protein
MELTNQIFLFEKQKITALDDRVVIEYKSLVKEFRVEYKYSELKSRVVKGRSGDPVWNSIGNVLIATAFTIGASSVFLFPNFLHSPYYRIVVLGLATLGLIAYGLRLVKHDKVWFDEKDDNSSFMIKLPKKNREETEKMISYITEKILASESKSALKVD